MQGDVTSIESKVDAIPTTAMRGTDSANTVVPDIAGTAATLHGVTDGKIDTVDGNVDAILEDTATIDWTDITFIKDVAGGDTAIVGTQLIFYNASHVEVCRFDLTLVDDEPTARTRT